MSDQLGKVQRKDGKVWIEGIPKLSWGTNKECTFAGAIEARLTIAVHPMKYSDIMGYSGLAFRFRWMDRTTNGGVWGVASPVGEFPEEIDMYQKLTGWQITYDNTGLTQDLEDPKIVRFRQQIVSSIDSGNPVIAHLVEGNVGVIYGYENEGKGLIGRDYMRDYGEDEVIIPIDEAGPFIMFLNQKTPLSLSPSQILEKTLRLAVSNWKRNRGPKNDDRLYYGDAAYADWIQGLRDFEQYELTDKNLAEMFFANWWGFNCLCDARRAVILFLQDHKSLLGMRSQDCLEKAVQLYQQEASVLEAVYDSKDVFIGPWSDLFQNWKENWTKPMRKRERDILEKCRQLESEAIREIEQALELREEG
jgi:hypothetical protein